MDTISYGSLCTGYDGLGTALRLADSPIVERWFAENDPAMSEVLKREHPDVPNVGDVKAAPWHLAPHTDLMSSGDPCQSISIAGRQEGRADPRFLWPWVRDAYRTVQPGGIFFENVANIVSHDKGRTLAERLEHLRTDGYAVRWTVLGACAVGAPHHRHRWYAVAAYVGAGAPEAVRVGTKALCGAPRSGGRWMLPTPTARDGNGRGEGSAEFWERRQGRRGSKESPPLGAVVNLLPTPDASMATRGGLLSAPMALKRIADPMRSSNLDDVVASLLPTPITSDGTAGPGRTVNREGANDLRTAVTLLPTPKASDGSNGGPNQRDGAGNYYLPAIANLLPDTEAWGKYADAIALWELIIGIPAPAPTEISPKGSRRLNPALPEWMMGLRPGLLTDHLDRADALKGAGNGVVPLAAAAAWRLLTC